MYLIKVFKHPDFIFGRSVRGQRYGLSKETYTILGVTVIICRKCGRGKGLLIFREVPSKVTRIMDLERSPRFFKDHFHSVIPWCKTKVSKTIDNPEGFVD